jgi:hypothetical protein
MSAQAPFQPPTYSIPLSPGLLKGRVNSSPPFDTNPRSKGPTQEASESCPLKPPFNPLHTQTLEQTVTRDNDTPLGTKDLLKRRANSSPSFKPDQRYLLKKSEHAQALPFQSLICPLECHHHLETILRVQD